MIGKLVAIAIGLTAGNYLYQAAGGHHWLIAFERSWFAWIALLVVWFVFRHHKFQ